MLNLIFQTAPNAYCINVINSSPKYSFGTATLRRNVIDSPGNTLLKCFLIFNI